MKGQQLPLGVQLREAASFENFYPGPNAAATAALRSHAATSGSAVFLYGPPGAGKTHLLQALVREAGEARRRCAYLPLAELARLGAGALDGLEDLHLVCVDELDAVLQQPHWVLALVRLIDRLRAADASYVLAARSAPDRLTGLLPDLATRLKWCAPYGLKPLSDADRQALLTRLAQARGLTLPPEVARYLLARLPRDTGTLIGVLEELDRASLTAQRRLTVPFVQQSLPAALLRATAQRAPG